MTLDRVVRIIHKLSRAFPGYAKRVRYNMPPVHSFAESEHTLSNERPKNYPRFAPAVVAHIQKVRRPR